ncbi:hypothetical protein DASB73_033750 [Starmerella bacillaris]|uniref:Uncharacterized protein n=1 Tax=Starmerella bacillaris TaxID=1247836 RepID=A0AAV5RMD5_STABA|nr:hypothetical protein DASB73_033750 [Starmerella bacillaris]
MAPETAKKAEKENTIENDAIKSNVNATKSQSHASRPALATKSLNSLAPDDNKSSKIHSIDTEGLYSAKRNKIHHNQETNVVGSNKIAPNLILDKEEANSDSEYEEDLWNTGDKSMKIKYSDYDSLSSISFKKCGPFIALPRSHLSWNNNKENILSFDNLELDDIPL